MPPTLFFLLVLAAAFLYVGAHRHRRPLRYGVRQRFLAAANCLLCCGVLYVMCTQVVPVFLHVMGLIAMQLGVLWIQYQIHRRQLR